MSENPLALCPITCDLIVTIVNKNQGRRVVEISKEAGAKGGTILGGRGTGIHEKAKLFGISIDPEKEIVLTLVPDTITDDVFESIIRQAELHKPGKGLCFVLEVKKLGGICHLAES